MTADLRTINQAAAEHIRTAGWTQGTERDNNGQVCLTGALRYCDPQPGDFELAREVYRHLDHAEGWNDDGERTATDVIGYLVNTPITDELLEQTYGPQWEQIVALVRRAAVLTREEADQLDAARAAARDAARAAARAAARDAARAAARDAARDAAWAAAWDAARTAARAAARAAARDAAWAAALALVVRDLLLTTEQGRKDYAVLTGPWAAVISPVHPDDITAPAAQA